MRFGLAILRRRLAMKGMAASLSAMPAPFDGGKARRKIATYGKAARRQIPGYIQPTVVATNPAPEVGAWEDGVETGSISPSISVRTTTTSSGRVFIRSPKSKSLERKRGDGQPDVDFHSIILPPPERAEERAAINSREVYDVPSSGDEHNLEQDVGSASMRKRRKIQLSTIRDRCDVVHDDASLQRHISAEAGDENSCVSSRSKAPSVERNQKYQEVRVSKAQRGSHRTSTVGGHPLSIIRSSRGTSTTLTKTAAGPHGDAIQRATGSKQRPTLEPMPCRQRTPTAVSSALAKTSRVDHKSCIPRHGPLPPAEPTLASSPGRSPGRVYRETAIPAFTRNTRLRTPSPSHESKALRTTPRQRELWTMLLTEENQEASPDRLNAKKTCLIPPRSVKQRSLDLGTQYAKAVVGTSVEQPRRRLVDKLHGHKVACTSLDSDSEQEAETSNTGSNDNTSLISPADGSNNVASSLTSESQSMRLTTRVEMFQKPSQLISLLPGGGPKVTYARQRSYLTESNLDEATSFSAPLVQDPDDWSDTRRRGRRSEVLVPKQKLHFEDQLDEGDGGYGGAVRSIHELREAGGNARLASEMESLIDDLDEKTGLPLAVRRRGLLVVVVKLQEPTFCRRFIDHGLVHRLMAHAESSTDLVSNILLAASMLYLVARKVSPDTRHQVIEQSSVDFFVGLLENDLDITAVAKDRHSNMSKVAQMEFLKLREALLEPSLWTIGPPPKVTARVLAIQCLEYMVRQVRERGSTVEFMSQTAIKRMVELLTPDPLQQSPLATASEMFTLKLAVSTLESSTTSGSAMCDETVWTGETIERLIGLLPTIEIWPESEEMFGSLRTLVLRLYLNITNNNPSLCEAFSRPEVVRAMFRIIGSHFHSLTDDARRDTQALLLDNLILSLGFLINLAEWSDDARRLVLSFERDTDSPLETLLQLFQRKLQRAAEVSAGRKQV